LAGVVLLDVQLERLLRGEGGRVRDGAAAAVAPRRNSAGPVLEIALGGRPLLAPLQLVEKIDGKVLGAREVVRWEATVGRGRRRERGGAGKVRGGHTGNKNKKKGGGPKTTIFERGNK